MPPKVRIKKEDILRAALWIVRSEGEDALNVRRIAAELGCSTQPVFSNYPGMKELLRDVVAEAERMEEDYRRREAESGRYPPYKATGMAYIRFATEERELFRMLYMRDRRGQESPAQRLLWERMQGIAQRAAGIGAEGAELFHLEIWAFVHGIAVMQATGYLRLEEELVSRMVTDAFLGLKSRHEENRA